MAEPRRVVLFQGSDRARVRVGESVWEDVQVVPLREGDLEPDAPTTAVLLRAGADRAIVRVDGVRYEGAEMAVTRIADDGTVDEVAVRVKEVVDRMPQQGEGRTTAKPDAFWSRVFRKKGEE